MKRGNDDNREGGCSDSVCQEMEFQAKSRLSRHKYNLRNFMLLVLSLDVSHLLRPDLVVVKIDFPGIPASHSRSQKSGRQFSFPFPFPNIGNAIFIPVPIPKCWEWKFSFSFPFPKFGNGLSYSRSRSQSPKSHSRSPLVR